MDNMLQYAGQVYDVIQALFVVFLYLIALIALVSSIRERCRNRWLIILLAVLGMVIQTFYLIGPYWPRSVSNNYTGPMPADNHNVSKDNSGKSAIQSNLWFTNDRHDKQNIALHDDIIFYKSPEDAFTQKYHSGGELNTDADVDVTSVWTTKAVPVDYLDFSCADLRLVALCHGSLLFTVFVVAAVKQMVEKKHQTIVICGVVVYDVILTIVITILYLSKTSDNYAAFTLGSSSSQLQLFVCSQSARSQLLPFLLETICLFGPCVGVLLLVLSSKSGHGEEKHQRFRVFQECRSESDEDCRACTEANAILRNVLICVAFILFVLRPSHYTYVFVSRGQFYDIWLIACTIIVSAAFSLNTLFNLISSKDSKSVIPTTQREALAKQIPV